MTSSGDKLIIGLSNQNRERIEKIKSKNGFDTDDEAISFLLDKYEEIGLVSRQIVSRQYDDTDVDWDIEGIEPEPAPTIKVIPYNEWKVLSDFFDKSKF